MRRYSLSNKLVIFQLSIKRIKRRGKAKNNASDYTSFSQLQVIAYKAANIAADAHKDDEVYSHPAENGEGFYRLFQAAWFFFRHLICL